MEKTIAGDVLEDEIKTMHVKAKEFKTQNGTLILYEYGPNDTRAITKDLKGNVTSIMDFEIF